MSRGERKETIRRGHPINSTAIVMNGSPIFTGGSSSGESEIRRWMLETSARPLRHV